MTEAEAMKKWCPFARVVRGNSAASGGVDIPGGQPSFNRALGGDGNTDSFAIGNCVGSACMAWRWNEPWTSRAEEGHGGDIVIRLKRKPGEPKLGYCGLAGQPT